MSNDYDINKAVSLSRRIIEGQAGKRIDFIKLINMLYLCERLHYATFNKFIINDELVSMHHCPVLYRTYVIITDIIVWNAAFPRITMHEVNYIWNSSINIENNEMYCVEDEEHTCTLRDDEKLTCDVIIAQYGDVDKCELVEILLTLPEWEYTNTVSHISKDKLDRVLQSKIQGEMDKLLK